MPYKNRLDTIEHQRVYDATHRDEKKAYYAANREKRLAYDRLYRVEHPDKKFEHSTTHRARKLASFVEVVDRQVVFYRDAGVCGECWSQGFPGIVDPQDWHLDHIQSLARGGNHSYANTQVTHPVCNQRKGSK